MPSKNSTHVYDPELAETIHLLLKSIAHTMYTTTKHYPISIPSVLSPKPCVHVSNRLVAWPTGIRGVDEPNLLCALTTP